MRKLYFSLAFLAAFLFCANRANADIVNNYTVDFNTAISTSSHDFKVGSGWGHIVDRYYDEDEYDYVYVSYSYSTSAGRDGSGALKAGSQTLGSGWSTKTATDLLVTPAVTGKASVWVKKASSSTGNIKFYAVTKDGATLKADSEISVDVPTLSDTEWTQVEIPGLDNQCVGIRANNVYIDDFTADQADVELQKAMTIQKVVYTGPSSQAPDCNADGKFPISYKVTVKNSGDVELAEGMEGYSLSVVNYSKSNAVVFTVPLTAALAVGEEATVDIAGEADYGTYPDRNRYDVREDLTLTSTYGTWLSPSPYKPVMKLRDDNGRMDNGEAAYAWGMVNEETSKKFTVSNDGAAPLTVTAVEVPDGFVTSITSPFTLAAHADSTFTITLPVTTPGIYSGVVTVKGEGVDDFTFSVSGTVVDASKFFADFEDGKIPAGSFMETGWTVVQRDYNSSSNSYMLSNGSQSTDNKFITPLLKVAEGEKMSIDVARSGYYTSGDGVYLNVYYSTDRQHWTLARKIEGSELSSKRAVSSYSYGELSTFVIDNIPAGNYYIGFGAGYTCIDNIYGFEKIAVTHDLMMKDSKLPKAATVNHEYAATATLHNVNAADEAADSYTASLYMDGKVVATAPAPALASGADASFAFAYTPHKAGVVRAYMEFKNTADGYTLTSDTVEVAVAEETASATLTVGSGTSTSNLAPIQWYNADVKGSDDILYGADMLKKYGLKAGAKITSISFAGTSSQDKNLSNVNLYAYVGAVDSTAFVPGTEYEGLQKVEVSTGESFSFTSGQTVATTLELAEPVVWDGESAIRVLTFVSGSTYVNVKYPCDDTYKSAYSSRGEIGSASYTERNTPIAEFGIQTEPSVVSGKVTCGGAAVADAVVTLTSGDVIYTGTTSAEGDYSLSVIQTDKTYSLTVSADGFDDYTESGVDVTASLTKDIALKRSVVVVGGKVLYRGAAVAGATVSLAHGETVYTAVTADDGSYKMEEVLPGMKYAVKAAAEKYAAYEAADSVELTADTVLADITLHRLPVKVHGTVAWGSTPVAGAKVMLAREGADYTAVSDAEGKYEVEGVVPDLNYALTVEAADYADYAETDSVTVADDMEKNISMAAMPIAIEVPESGCATFSAKRAVDFTQTPGVKAYVVKGVKDNYTLLEEVDAVPANTGVLLKADAGSYGLMPVETADAVADNMLRANVDADRIVRTTDEGFVWALSTDEHGIPGFASVAGTVIPAGSAYLYVGSEEGFIYLDVASGLNAVDAASGDRLDTKAAMYNAAGQRVGSAYKGIVIQNGRKYGKK